MPGLSGVTESFGSSSRRGADGDSRFRPVHKRTSGPGRLTPREAEVLHWLACGKSGPEIAIILGISTCTVRIHIQSVKRKLNATNIPHAVSLAVELGILRF